MTGPLPGRETAIGGEGLPKIGVHWDQSAAAVLGRNVAQLDHRTNVAGWIEHHVPGQVGNLTGPQARLGGQQDDHAVTERMSGATGKNQEVADVAKRKYFCLLASHVSKSNCSSRLTTHVADAMKLKRIKSAGHTDKVLLLSLSVHTTSLKKNTSELCPTPPGPMLSPIQTGQDQVPRTN